MSSLSDPLELVGTTLAEKYAIERVVGAGGFAVVYRATHLVWKRPVAVKVFSALRDVPEEQRPRLLDDFIGEGRILAELSERSPAICQARDVGMFKSARGDEVPYMVLEWLDGAPLDAVVASEIARQLPPRSIGDVVRLLEPAAQALALAHQRGIAHRDVKPANIFVLGDPRSPDATVKLLDFGIAKVVQDAQRMAGGFGQTTGQMTSFTPQYGAPEQFNRAHGATGPWTDVFAFALMVAELATHKEALAGETLMQLAFASLDKARRPTPRTLGADVPDAVDAVFAHALAVDVASRPQTMGEFWSELRAALDMPPARFGPSLPPSAPVVDGAAATVLQASAPGAAATWDPAKTTIDPSSAKPLKRALGGLAVGAIALAAIGVFARHGAAPNGARPGAGGGAAGAGASSGGPAASGAAPAASGAAAAAAAANGGCPDGMIAIPGGEYFQGNDEGTPPERPAHHVLLDGYCIDRFEVTAEAYKRCSDDGRCKRAPTTNVWSDESDAVRTSYDALCNARDPAGHAKHPINCVDWEMASTYCAAHGARLPSEAEWEFAARGSDGRTYPWGDEMPSAQYLNACGTECVAWGKAMHLVGLETMYAESDGFPATAPVGSFPKGRSRYGLDDVAGNVWEWVGDWYAPYAAGEAKNPTGPASGTERVMRGGAWNGANPSWVRPTFRFHDIPKQRSHGVGFRCARTRP